MHQRPPSSVRRRSPPPGQPARHVNIFAKAPAPEAFFVSGAP